MTHWPLHNKKRAAGVEEEEEDAAQSKKKGEVSAQVPADWGTNVQQTIATLKWGLNTLMALC